MEKKKIKDWWDKFQHKEIPVFQGNNELIDLVQKIKQKQEDIQLDVPREYISNLMIDNSDHSCIKLIRFLHHINPIFNKLMYNDYEIKKLLVPFPIYLEAEYKITHFECGNIAVYFSKDSIGFINIDQFKIKHTYNQLYIIENKIKNYPKESLFQNLQEYFTKLDDTRLFIDIIDPVDEDKTSLKKFIHKYKDYSELMTLLVLFNKKDIQENIITCLLEENSLPAINKQLAILNTIKYILDDEIMMKGYVDNSNEEKLLQIVKPLINDLTKKEEVYHKIETFRLHHQLSTGLIEKKAASKSKL